MHTPTLFQRPDVIRRPLYVLTVVFNSPRYRVRWKLYDDFARAVRDHGAILYTAEIAFGEREFAVTEPGNPCHLQLRTSSELWFKENALNLLAQRLPPDWKYVAWIDADVKFVRDDWADECIHLLQHYAVLQMWSEAADLDLDNQIMHHWKSLAWCYTHGLPTKPRGGTYYDAFGYYPGAPPAVYPHAGYAWATRRDIWDALGGLIDFAVLGAADWHMGHAILEQMETTLQSRYHPRYRELMLEWQGRAKRSVRRNFGVMPGMILHYYHGPKEFRRYQTRNEILVRTQFNPDVDLKRDWQGLYQLTGRSIELRDSMRRYFHERMEDARV